MEAPRGDAGLSAAAPTASPRWRPRLAVALSVCAAAPAAGCGDRRPPEVAAYADGLAAASREWDEPAVEEIGVLRSDRPDAERLAALERLVALTDRFGARLGGLAPPPDAAAAHADLRGAIVALAEHGRRALRLSASEGVDRALGALGRDPEVRGEVGRARDAQTRLRQAGYRVDSPLG